MRQSPGGPLRNIWVTLRVKKKRLMSGSILMRDQTIDSILLMTYSIAKTLFFLINGTLISSDIEWPSSGEVSHLLSPRMKGAFWFVYPIMAIPSPLLIKRKNGHAIQFWSVKNKWKFSPSFMGKVSLFLNMRSKGESCSLSASGCACERLWSQKADIIHLATMRRSCQCAEGDRTECGKDLSPWWHHRAAEYTDVKLHGQWEGKILLFKPLFMSSIICSQPIFLNI